VEEVCIDVRDVDYEWFREVRVFLDRVSDRFYLPEESVQRLGEQDETTGDYFLLDGQITAANVEIQVEGQRMTVWTVPTSHLRSRPAERRG